MKKMILLSAAAILTAVSTGCSTVVDYSLPDGYEPGARKDVVVIKFRTPTPGDKTELTQSDVEQLYEFSTSHFIKNKRFVVLTDKPGELSHAKSHDLEVWAVVSKLESRAPGKVAYGAKVQFNVKVANTNAGAYEEASDSRDLLGVARPRVIEVPMFQDPRSVTLDWNGVFQEAYVNALYRLDGWLMQHYPINATVVSIKNKFEKTELSIDRGTNYGMNSAYTFVVYYVDKDGNYTSVALATGQVGKTRSQLTITDWNTKDSEVANELMPRIQRGDKTLLGNLFVVCR